MYVYEYLSTCGKQNVECQKIETVRIYVTYEIFLNGNILVPYVRLGFSTGSFLLRTSSGESEGTSF